MRAPAPTEPAHVGARWTAPDCAGAAAAVAACCRHRPRAAAAVPVSGHGGGATAATAATLSPPAAAAAVDAAVAPCVATADAGGARRHAARADHAGNGGGHGRMHGNGHCNGVGDGCGGRVVGGGSHGRGPLGALSLSAATRLAGRDAPPALAHARHQTAVKDGVHTRATGVVHVPAWAVVGRRRRRRAAGRVVNRWRGGGAWGRTPPVPGSTTRLG